MRKNEKKPEVKNHNRPEEVRKKVGNLKFVIVGLGLFSLIPLFFCCCFHDNEYSVGIWFIPSNISASNWFSFWITYLSLCVTAFLTYRAYILSRDLAKYQVFQQLESDRMKFRIFNIDIVGSNRGLRIYLPIDVVSIKNLEIGNSYISFNGVEKYLELNISSEDKKLKKNTFELFFPQSMDLELETALNLWILNPYTQSGQFRTAVLTVNFTYDFISYQCKKKIDIRSIVSFSTVLDKDKIEKFKINDIGVYNPESESDSNQISDDREDN